MTMSPESSTLKKFRVVVVDDRQLPRIAAKAMLGEAPQLRVVGEASSGPEAIEVVRSVKPDVVLMDVEMPGMDGAETTERLLREHPDTIVIAWTVSDSSDDLLRMMRSGCAGYVLKDAGPEELHRAILTAIRLELPIPRRMVPDVVKRALKPGTVGKPVVSQLTHRETEVLKAVARGRASKQIATELGISQRSVDTHLRNLYAKLGVNSRVEALSLALRSGLLNISDL